MLGLRHFSQFAPIQPDAPLLAASAEGFHRNPVKNTAPTPFFALNSHGSGATIGPYDMMIAGHARALGLILVSNNVKVFERVPGLRLQNWA